MKVKTVILFLLLTLPLLSTVACGGGSGPTATPTPAPTLTPTQEPTPGQTPTNCEADRDAIQAALYAYHGEEGKWPTADGEPGDIEWDRLAPGFLGDVPSTDSKCDWQVNDDPYGEVCLLETC